MFGRRKPLDVRAGGGLVVGAEDSVRGTLQARAVTVAGRVDGTLDVAGALLVTETGRVSGTVRATRFVVAPGAVVRAACRIGPTPAAVDGDTTNGDRENGDRVNGDAAQTERAVLRLESREVRKAAGDA